MKRNVFFMAGMVMFFVACTSKEEDFRKEEMEAVDLGLSVKWAKCNIGATKPEEYGDYFAWGEKEPHYLASWKTDAKPLLAIGPEGGWTDEEVAKLIENGFRGYSLGSRILRTDTATIALLAQLMKEYE